MLALQLTQQGRPRRDGLAGQNDGLVLAVLLDYPMRNLPKSWRPHLKVVFTEPEQPRPHRTNHCKKAIFCNIAFIEES